MLFQGQGHFGFKVIPESKCKCLEFYPKSGGGPSTECMCYLLLKSSILRLHRTQPVTVTVSKWPPWGEGHRAGQHRGFVICLHVTLSLICPKDRVLLVVINYKQTHQTNSAFAWAHCITINIGEKLTQNLTPTN